METFLRWVPRAQPPAIRYSAMAAMVLLTFLLRLGIDERTISYGFILFIPAIVAVSLFFGRAPGFVAVVLSIGLTAALLRWPDNADVHAAALATFAIVGAGLVLLSDGLHRALERAHKAEQEKDLLLQEMSHRVKNKFATISSIINMQARQSSPEVSAALEAIGGRIKVIARVHDYLQLSHLDGFVDMNEYLGGLCRSLGDALRDLRPVTVNVAAESVALLPDRALSIGLIVNELVINAFKYAFPDDRPGHVLVRLVNSGTHLELSIEDDGIGCAETTDTGLGMKLVALLTAQLGGSAKREFANPGCRVRATIPII